MSFFKPWVTSKPSQLYTPLTEDEDTEKRRGNSLSSEETYTQHTQRRRPTLIYTLIGLSSVNLLCLLLLFYVNTRHSTADVKKSVVPERMYNFQLPLEHSQKRLTNIYHVVPLVSVNFDKDTRFSGPPSPDNNAAWDSILPVSFRVV